MNSRFLNLWMAAAIAAAGLHTSAHGAAPVSALVMPTDAVQSTFVHAPTRFVDVGDARLAYRRFGPTIGTPLLLFQHFVGTMDGWDPAVLDGLARGREVIVFDNAGVAGSTGEVPPTVKGMAAYGIGLIDALGLHQADLLGFSLGSLVAQQVALDRPDLVRKVILVGSGPRSGDGMATLTPEFQAMLAKPRSDPDDLLLDVFFTPSAASQAAGRAFLKRLHWRTENLDAAISDRVVPAQVAAFAEWGAPGQAANAELLRLRKPVLVVSGSEDLVHYSANAWRLQRGLPDAQLILYPDAAHGALYQDPVLFVQHATLFLDGASR
jgi:pimeloyl-ACP methyl ester carboxylesterase